MGSDKGGSSDQSGMYAAMASAQAADKAYALGEQQFEWSKQVWEQEQPLVDASEQAQIDYSNQLAKSLTQMQDESGQQWQEYTDYYKPLEEKYIGEAENWDSPDAIAQARGEAMSSVAEQGTAGLNTAAETLRAYGVNPGAPRYASLYTGAQPMIGAAEAAAGTTAANNLRMQKMALESGAINTGRNLVNESGSLTGVGNQSGAAGSSSASGAGNTAFGNVGSTAVGAGATAGLFNAGSNAMQQYVSSVNGFNESQAALAQANATEMAGIGSAIGGVAGLGLGKFMHVAKGGPIHKFAYGGPIGYDDGGPTDPQMTPDQGGGATGIPSAPMQPAQVPPGAPSDATPGGGVPAHASPSNGQVTDDVPALLTANEFVIPKDVATWKGHEYFAKQIDQARKAQQMFAQRDDIGGEPSPAIPQQPTFVSRPSTMGTTQGAIPGLA